MDSKRSWVVAGACFWTNVFAYPLLGAAGVVYVNILHTFHVTREEASWPVSLTSTFYLLAGLLGGILNKYVSIRAILVVSCALSALLVSACYFTTGLWFLIVVLGVFHGIFVGGIRLNVVAINKHFTKHLASASGLNMAGLSVGGFVLPPLLQLLFDQYGFRGALLICGGISLNAVPAALLCGDPDKPKTSAMCTAEHKETNKEGGFGKVKTPEEQVIPTELSATVYYPSDTADVLPDKSLKEVSGVLHRGRCGAPRLGLGDGQEIPVQGRLDCIVLVVLGCGVGTDAARAFFRFVVCVRCGVRLVQRFNFGLSSSSLRGSDRCASLPSVLRSRLQLGRPRQPLAAAVDRSLP
ncbi:hypothetical protein MTO96_048241 [Rhipicephalus appendiculatus]